MLSWISVESADTTPGEGTTSSSEVIKDRSVLFLGVSVLMSSSLPLILRMNMGKGGSPPYPPHGSRDHQQARETGTLTLLLVGDSAGYVWK